MDSSGQIPQMHTIAFWSLRRPSLLELGIWSIGHNLLEICLFLYIQEAAVASTLPKEERESKD
jgi:hypothetical protein